MVMEVDFCMGLEFVWPWQWTLCWLATLYGLAVTIDSLEVAAVAERTGGNGKNTGVYVRQHG